MRELKELARRLLLEGRSIREVMGETGLPEATLRRILGWLNSPYGKMWAQKVRSKPASNQAGQAVEQATSLGLQA